jgi:hypothetical protein
LGGLICGPGSVGSFIGDDLAQIFDAVLGEGRHPVLADAVDPKAAVFGEHVDREIVQPFFVLAEQVGDAADGEDGAAATIYEVDPGNETVG